jgi:hypothetical protein
MFETGKYFRRLKMGHCPVNCTASSSEGATSLTLTPNATWFLQNDNSHVHMCAEACTVKQTNNKTSQLLESSALEEQCWILSTHRNSLYKYLMSLVCILVWPFVFRYARKGALCFLQGLFFLITGLDPPDLRNSQSFPHKEIKHAIQELNKYRVTSKQGNNKEQASTKNIS